MEVRASDVVAIHGYGTIGGDFIGGKLLGGYGVKGQGFTGGYFTSLGGYGGWNVGVSGTGYIGGEFVGVKGTGKPSRPNSTGVSGTGYIGGVFQSNDTTTGFNLKLPARDNSAKGVYIYSATNGCTSGDINLNSGFDVYVYYDDNRHTRNAKKGLGVSLCAKGY